MQKLKIEFSKFAAVGAANFVFTLILFYLLVEIVVINYLIALTAVSLIGMFFTYTLNYVWAFKTDDKLVFKGRLLKYVFSGALSISLNVVILNYIVESTSFKPFYVQLTLIPLIVIFNFSTARFWSLKPSKETPRPTKDN